MKAKELDRFSMDKIRLLEAVPFLTAPKAVIPGKPSSMFVPLKLMTLSSKQAYREQDVNI